MRFVSLIAFLVGSLVSIHPALAQDDEEGEAEASDEAAEGGGEGDEAASDEEAPEGEKEAPEGDDGKPADTSPVEKKGVTYRFIGLRYRGYIVPKFMMSLFGADGGTTVYAHNFGPEFIIRKDNFEYNLSVTYTSYAFDATPFKAKSDGEDAWELVESHIKVLYFGADFLWSHPFDEQLALNYGFGTGLGFVWGDLNRVQAYQNANGNYEACVAPGNPDPAYCGNDNDHYDDYTEANWADGGSKPIVFPWFAGQIGLRFKPHKNFAMHVDAGLAPLGHVFFGVGADYGL
jgi:hypothetical protein